MEIFMDMNTPLSLPIGQIRLTTNDPKEANMRSSYLQAFQHRAYWCLCENEASSPGGGNPLIRLQTLDRKFGCAQITTKWNLCAVGKHVGDDGARRADLGRIFGGGGSLARIIKW